MSPFRGSDEQLEREIAVLEGIVRLRVRRTATDLRELERDLHELRRELKRRRGGAPAWSDESADANVPA